MAQYIIKQTKKSLQCPWCVPSVYVDKLLTNTNILAVWFVGPPWPHWPSTMIGSCETIFDLFHALWIVIVWYQMILASSSAVISPCFYTIQNWLECFWSICLPYCRWRLYHWYPVCLLIAVSLLQAELVCISRVPLPAFLFWKNMIISIPTVANKSMTYVYDSKWQVSQGGPCGHRWSSYIL